MTPCTSVDYYPANAVANRGHEAFGMWPRLSVDCQCIPIFSGTHAPAPDVDDQDAIARSRPDRVNYERTTELLLLRSAESRVIYALDRSGSRAVEITPRGTGTESERFRLTRVYRDAVGCSRSRHQASKPDHRVGKSVPNAGNDRRAGRHSNQRRGDPRGTPCLSQDGYVDKWTICSFRIPAAHLYHEVEAKGVFPENARRRAVVVGCNDWQSR